MALSLNSPTPQASNWSCFRNGDSYPSCRNLHSLSGIFSFLIFFATI